VAVTIPVMSWIFCQWLVTTQRKFIQEITKCSHNSQSKVSKIYWTEA